MFNNECFIFVYLNTFQEKEYNEKEIKFETTNPEKVTVWV